MLNSKDPFTFDLPVEGGQSRFMWPGLESRLSDASLKSDFILTKISAEKEKNIKMQAGFTDTEILSWHNKC